MPELPEVETMRRGILRVAGHQIEAVEQPPCRLRPILIEPAAEAFASAAEGRTITAVSRRGKRVLLELDDRAIIAIEPRMTGLVLVADPPNETHLRLRLRLLGPHHRELLFWDRRGLGTVRLLRFEQIEPMLGPARLGRDALEISVDQLRAQLGGSRRAIKVALLDQRAVAGIGNLYAAEILFVAGVDPRTRCDRLTRPQWRRIHAATQAVLSEAIRYEGSTLADGTYRNAINGEGSYQNQHRVYDRAGRVCPRCGEQPIRRIVQAQRSTFFCAGCQRRTGRHASLAD